MNTFTILCIALLGFVVLVLALFALSSCLGDELRAVWSGREPGPPTTYGLQYGRSLMNSGSHTGWEQIEMADLLDKDGHRRFED